MYKKYQKRTVCTRGEKLTDLNKNINISIIDNHNESKSRWILFKMACSYITCAYLYREREREKSIRNLDSRTSGLSRYPSICDSIKKKLKSK